MDEYTRQRILNVSRERFFEAGFSRMSMDEIGRSLRMSKRTLYQYFPSKRELLRQVLADTQDRIEAGLEEILADGDSGFIQKWEGLLEFTGRNLPNPGQLFLRDIAGSAPDLWEAVSRRRAGAIQRCFDKLFAEGVREGLVEQSLNQDFLILALQTLVQNLINPTLLSQMPMGAGDVLREILRLFSLGVLTARGRNAYAEGLEMRTGR